jgi:hypothetical protein
MTLSLEMMDSERRVGGVLLGVMKRWSIVQLMDAFGRSYRESGSRLLCITLERRSQAGAFGFWGDGVSMSAQTSRTKMAIKSRRARVITHAIRKRQDESLSQSSVTQTRNPKSPKKTHYLPLHRIVTFVLVLSQGR